MTATLILVTGVGTGVGKTHLAEALVRAASASQRVVGYKPIESGVEPGQGTDQDRLDGASTFHVKHPRVELAAPISPHLALRREGRTLDLAPIQAHVARLREDADLVVVELAGGAFTPLDDTRTNADLLAAFPDARRVLVALDRLGVLHEVIATQRALAHEPTPITIDAIALNAPHDRDASTGTNAEELTGLLRIPVTSFPRVTTTDFAHSAAALHLFQTLERDGQEGRKRGRI